MLVMDFKRTIDIDREFLLSVMNFKRMLSFFRAFLVLDIDFKQTIEIDEEDIRAC